MTNYGSPYPAGGDGGQPWGQPGQPYGQPGQPYGQPVGGYGPPGGYGGPGGPGATAPRPFPLWPVIVVTLFFALFGLIPTVIASNRASERRESSGRYWLAFVLSLVGSFVLYTVLILLLVLVVFASTAAVVGAAAKALPDITFSPPSLGTGVPAAGATTGPCAYTPSATTSSTPASLPDDPDPTPTATRTWTLVTTAGTVVVQLDGAAAPCTVQSIVSLTQQHFYDDTPCPRVVNQGIFVLQCGDPNGDGTGGPGYTFADENLASADYSPGAVAMANSGADTNGSQFFVVDKDGNGALSKSYTVFGRVTSGLDVVDKIVTLGSDDANGPGDGKPVNAVTVVSATIS